MKARLCLIAACLLSCFATGCSWLFVDKAPPNHAQLRYFDCTSSKIAPVLDTVEAVGGSLAAGIIASDSSYGSDKAAGVAVEIGLAAVFAASAIYGYTATSDCRDAKDALAARIKRGAIESAPESYRLGPPSGPPLGGCTYDTQCKGNRICRAGQCVSPDEPAPRAAPAFPPPPVSTTPPAPAPEGPPPASAAPADGQTPVPSEETAPPPPPAFPIPPK